MQKLGLLLASIIVACAATADAAVVLCARPRLNGTFATTVKIRTGACMSRETQLDPVALGLQGPKGDPGAPGPGLVVKDANDATVGVVVDLQGPTPWGRISRQVGSEIVLFGIVDDGSVLFPAGGNAEFHYESPDCSGQAWATPESIGPYRLGILVPPDGLGYIANPGVSVTVQSAEQTGAGFTGQPDCDSYYGPAAHAVFIPPNRCCAPQSLTTSFYGRVVTLGGLDGSAFGVTPPFHVAGF